MNTENVAAYKDGITGLFPVKATTEISDPAFMLNKTLIQVPDTGSLADYTDEQVLQTYIDAAKEQELTTKRDVFISMGFHQESATWKNEANPKMTNIEIIGEVLSSKGKLLNFVTVGQAAQRWKVAQLPAPVTLEHQVALPHILATGSGSFPG